MQLENSFEVATSSEAAWKLLMDVPRVVPCMPGAELTEAVDDSNWKARVSVKLGPIALQFAADIARTEVDAAASRVVLTTTAREVRGRGAAQATIQSQLTELGPARTRVDVVTNLSLSGSVAQYGRGIVQDVAGQMVGKFADCLQKQLVGSEEEAQAAVQQASRPVSGLRMGAGAMNRAVLGSPYTWTIVFFLYMWLFALAVGAQAVASLVVSLVAAAGIFWFVRARGADYGT
jgi:carbon monoxide dehydrogenase subunit G